jgi:fatty acid desaturase
MDLDVEIQRLSAVQQNTIFAAKALIWAFMIAGGIALAVLFDSIALNILGTILIGAGFSHGVELQHQALHMTGFTSRALNRVFGTLLGLPMLVSFSEYRDSHLFHHQKLGTSEDSEFFDYGERESPKLTAVLKHFFLVNHFASFVKKFTDAVVFNEFATKLSSRSAAAIRADYLMMGGIFFGALFMTNYTGDTQYLVRLWLIPLFLVAAPIHALIELPEHYGCNRDTRDVFQNTRSIKSSAFMTWFTNGNNYHVEHHWKAALPIELLKKVHVQIEHKIENLSTSYLEFYKTFLKDVFFKRTEHRA